MFDTLKEKFMVLDLVMVASSECLLTTPYIRQLTVKCFCLFTDQEDRHWAIREFKENRKDVLVATDIASKGLDFSNIQHVINYDMPTDIENYGKDTVSKTLIG